MSTPLTAYVTGIGLIAPGLPDWSTAAAVLRGEQPHTPAPTVLPVPELLPPAEECPTLPEDALAAYEAALTAFEAKDWSRALRHLHTVPPEDLAKDFLTLYIAQHGRTPPPNWDGAIVLEGK